MQHQLVTSPAPPSRAQIQPAALELLARHSAGLLATARRYSSNPEDAEDAYQRGVEILLTKAPTTREEDLLPWLRTVVKHEAYAVSKASARAVPVDAPAAAEQDANAWTEERAERYERLRVGAEAMAGLKPQEIRCLLLKAEGLSYNEICDATGWSYTKVNRCLTEGRRAFLERVAGIESGAECKRLAPLISKVADGEASRDELRLVRPHLKSCLACKATLREYRATPSRIAGLVPPVVAIAGGGGTHGFAARMLAALHERFGAVGDAAGAKVAAVAASAVVLAGGGAAGIGALDQDPATVPPSAFQRASHTTAATVAATTAAPASQPPDPSTAAIQAVQAPSATAPHAAPHPSARSTPAPATPKPTSSAPEFDPGAAGADPPQPTREFATTQAAAPMSSAPKPETAPAEFAP